MRARVVALRFQFLPHKNYKQNFGVKPGEVLAYFENKFIVKVLMPVLSGVSKDKKVMVETGVDSDHKGRKMGGGGRGEAEDEDGEGNRRQESAADRVMGDAESSDEEEVGDGEGTDMTRRVERQGDREYEEMDEEEIDMNREIDRNLGDEYVEDDEEDRKPRVLSPTEDDEGLGEEVEEDPEDVGPLFSQEEAMSSGEPSRRKA